VKLYDVALSPFAARVRVQIYAKSLDIPLVAPPGGTGSDEYKRLNPTGKVPALVLDDGSVLPESLVIGEYLEDRFPEPSLRPADAVARARMRLVTHFTDGYVEPPLHALFPQVTDPAARDPKLIAEKTAELATRYDQLVRFLTPGGPYAMGNALTLADCALFPLFFFATKLHPMLGDKDPTASRPALAKWWEAVQQHPAVAKVNAELGKALAEQLSGPK
jgi:glutathione S-transferase